MKKIYIFIIIVCLFLLTSCWNYTDIDNMRFVSGVAIDYDEVKGEYIVTSEVVKLIKGGEKFGSALFQSRGETVFDGVRDTVIKNARRLYWGHAKVIILSKDITSKRLISILDYTSRDAEFRDNIWIVVSNEKTADSILENTFEDRQEIASFHIDNILKSEKNISTYHAVPAWKFIEKIYDKSTAQTLPIVSISEKNGEKIPKIGGQAIFRGGKIIGTLDEMETRAYLWVIDELKGGVLTVKTNIEGSLTEVTMELFNNKTKLQPKKVDNRIVMKIDVESDYGIGEISGEVNVIEKSARKTLKRDIENHIKKQIEDVIKKAQKEYESDIFGFGMKIKDKMPDEWKKIEPYWLEIFKNIEIEINVNVNIRSSALTSEPIKVKY
ncbi:Ger(x)C family spore germination protein [Maledivibacter halophilus]|uniref:Spore germination protein KC n=1 Tax=Maledivibacter halophilus TaxID=36842 RepID=A0A1T5MB60_9FIRM|nr:Ger(x)C family spore germination protein [Maledivibacter halophilus]SKC85481.1 spore germination protein KC [Maledivibacter halophilus]